MYAERHTVTLTTDGSGNATGYTPVVSGRVLAVHYVKAASGGFADGVDFDVTVESTGEVLLDKDDINASASFYPRKQVHDTTGTAATLDGTRAMREPVVVAEDRVKIAVASGGDTKSGSVIVVIG